MKKKFSKKKEIRKPRVYLLLGLVNYPPLIPFLIWTIQSAKEDPGWYFISVVFIIYLSNLFYLTMLQINWKIRIDGKLVYVRNCFRKTRKYSLDELIVLDKNPNHTGARVKFYLMYNNKKIATIVASDENADLLFSGKFKIRFELSKLK